MLVFFFPSTLKVIKGNCVFPSLRLLIPPMPCFLSLLPFISKLLQMVYYNQIYFFQNLKFNGLLSNLLWAVPSRPGNSLRTKPNSVFSTGQLYFTSSLSGLWYHHPTTHLRVRREPLSPLLYPQPISQGSSLLPRITAIYPLLSIPATTVFLQPLVLLTEHYQQSPAWSPHLHLSHQS